MVRLKAVVVISAHHAKLASTIHWYVTNVPQNTHRSINMSLYVPVTPAGSLCMWLLSSSIDEAWEKLLEDAKHMPYKDKDAFIARRYNVVEVEE